MSFFGRHSATQGRKARHWGSVTPLCTHPGQCRLCANMQSALFMIKMNGAKTLSGVSVAAVMAKEDDVLPSLSQPRHLYIPRDLCLCLPTHWEFLGSWDPERKQPSRRPAGQERRKGMASGRAEWKGWWNQEGM